MHSHNPVEQEDSLSNAGMPISPAKPSWSFLKKFTLIFFAVYFGLLMFETVISFQLLPVFLSKIWDWYYAAWDAAIRWTGKHVFHLNYEITEKPNGSGTTYNYVQIFLAVVFPSLFAAIDTAIRTAVFKEFGDTMRIDNFRYENPVKEQLVYKGRFADSLVINTKRYDENRFRLVNRGFHRINEYPYNR